MTDLKLAALVMRMLELRDSSHEPVCRQGWSDYRDEFRLEFMINFMINFSPVSEMRKGQRSWERVLASNLRNKAKMTKHENFHFRAYHHSFGNS